MTCFTASFTVRRAICVPAVLAALFTADANVVAASSAKRARYENLARTSYYEFDNGVGLSGTIVPSNTSADERPVFEDSLGHGLHDCSTAEYLCVRFWFRVFAVPRGAMSAGQKFTVAGANVRVEECLGRSDRDCRIAMLSSDCQVMIGVDECGTQAGGRAKSPARGPVTYFIYNEAHGVTAFGSSTVFVKSAYDRMSIASQMALQGEAGLLEASLTR